MNPDYERVYHYHVRKSAGSSLNAAFWALGGVDFATAEVRLRESPQSEFVGNGLRFVRNNPALLARGDYFFATTHRPAYHVELPPRTFTITILRDPASRVLSYYHYMMWARSSAEGGRDPFVDQVRSESDFMDRHPIRRISLHTLRTDSAVRELGAGQLARRMLPLRLRPERRIADRSFARFLARVSPRALLAQLYMFSPRFDPAEAAERVLGCSAVCFTETYAEDLKAVAAALELPLAEKRERRFTAKAATPEADLELLRERLAREYRMIELVKQGLGRTA
ncbi:MAG TPA: hypothetical protein VN752_10635 [Solirubrobacterales bacterium]|nr:hypothetical protein [Solirubrobacterales bacterium]